MWPAGVCFRHSSHLSTTLQLISTKVGGKRWNFGLAGGELVLVPKGIWVGFPQKVCVCHVFIVMYVSLSYSISFLIFFICHTKKNAPPAISERFGFHAHHGYQKKWVPPRGPKVKLWAPWTGAAAPRGDDVVRPPRAPTPPPGPPRCGRAASAADDEALAGPRVQPTPHDTPRPSGPPDCRAHHRNLRVPTCVEVCSP